jgi:GDP-4-dehydro-6-deoxy-D-mannose reductase
LGIGDSPSLVTGAAGFAGSHLIELLARVGSSIVAWHRPGGKAPLKLEGVSWAAVDLLDRAAVADAIRRHRPATIYHCAAAAHVGRAWDHTTATFEVNVRGTHHLVEALRTARLPSVFLVPSSAMIYRPADTPIAEDAPLLPSNPYGLSKLAQERLALRAIQDGLDVRIARAFNHVGPRQDPSFAASGFARQIAEIEAGRRQPEIVVGNLEARREVTDVRDTVRAYQTIVERGAAGCQYNVCSGRAYAIGQILDYLVARARVAVQVRVDPSRLRPNDVPVLVGDPSRLRDELGWTAAIPLEQTLSDILDYWRDQMR